MMIEILKSRRRKLGANIKDDSIIVLFSGEEIGRAHV